MIAWQVRTPKILCSTEWSQDMVRKNLYGLLGGVGGGWGQGGGGEAYMYGLLTKCEVKMAGYWPSSFFVCLWTETKKERGQYPTILTVQTWSIKDLLYGFREIFHAGYSGQSRAGKMAPSCPLGQPITARDLVHLARSRSQPYNKYIYIYIYIYEIVNLRMRATQTADLAITS